MRSLFLFLAISTAAAAAPATPPPVPRIYAQELALMNGKTQTLADFRGQVLLIVNTASHCGYTKQFAGLEKLYQAHKSAGLVVLGVPSNSFKQEFKDDKEVAAYCKLNFGVTFPMSKTVEVTGDKAHPLFAELVSQSPQDASGPVKWNFEKFLVDRQGAVVGRFRSAVTPDDPEFTKLLTAALKQK